VVSKLSGLGTFIHRNDPEQIAGIVRETVALFGADRCLFGSNFPIE
jgi:predicted TIM-barrel fold metal-dependent hydrolase